MTEKLRPAQIEAIKRAVAAMEGGGGFAIFQEQRVGKTLTGLRIVEALKPNYLWVICPKAAIPVWMKYIKESLRIPIHYCVVNYETVVNHRRQWYADAKLIGSTLFIICDESHFIKTRGSSRSRVVRHLGRFARYRLALTGTPIAQGIQDAWAQFDFIDPEIFGPFDDEAERTKSGHVIRVIREGFDSRYLIWGGYKKHQIIRYRNEDEFNSKFHAHSYRVTLREARKMDNGADKLLIRFTKKTFELTRTTRELYDRLQQELIAVVNERKIKVKNVLAAVMKLQQLTGGYLIDPEGSPRILRIGREKLDKLHETVRSLPAREKFIVICRFLHEIDAIQRYLNNLGYSTAVVRGGQPYSGKFACDCIVMQIQSGLAVDMSAASTIIFYSMDYSYLNFEQSRFRVLSYDKRAVRYFFLIGEDTIDEVIHEAVTRKKNLARMVCDRYRTRRGNS